MPGPGFFRNVCTDYPDGAGAQLMNFGRSSKLFLPDLTYTLIISNLDCENHSESSHFRLLAVFLLLLKLSHYGKKIFFRSERKRLLEHWA